MTVRGALGMTVRGALGMTTRSGLGRTLRATAREALGFAVCCVMAALGFGCTLPRGVPAYRVTLAGAQIPVELVQSWLNDAQDQHFIIETTGPLYLSQHGFGHLIRGDCDVACVDRVIARTEVEALHERVVAGRRVAFYGYALYVNPANTLDNIYAGHLKLLFSKKLMDWKELGGQEGPINLYGPVKCSRGGEVLMRQANIWFDAPTWTALGSDQEIVNKVAADPQAVGFASVGYDQSVRYLGLRMTRNASPVFPSLDEIETDRYGLAKVIYVYTALPPSPAASAVLDYLFSDRGRRAIESTEVWPIPRERSEVKPAP
jgi:phosphate transport system substrate-binding protein